MVVCVVICADAGRARAQTSGDHDVAVAEFKEARRYIESGDCARALGHLERSIAREPSVGGRMSIAECLDASDPTKAWRSLADAALLAYTNHDDRLSQAEARMIALERRVGTFHLGLSPADLSRPGLDVRVDSRPIDRFHLRRGIVAVESGEHLVEASAADRGTFTAKVRAPVPGASMLVPIELPERAPLSSVAPVVPVVVGPARPDPSDEARVTRRTIGFTLGAVGIVGLGVGAAFGIVALGRAADLDAACGGDRARCTRPPSSVSTLRDSGTTAATASTISFIAGGVALATGAALVFLSPSASASAPAKAAAVKVDIGPSGVGVGGSF